LEQGQWLGICGTGEDVGEYAKDYPDRKKFIYQDMAKTIADYNNLMAVGMLLSIPPVIP
jgi:hypothetical protein